MLRVTQREGDILVSADALARLIEALFMQRATPIEHAREVTDHLVTASLMGLHSHGVMRVIQYLDEIDRGETDPAARPRVRHARGASVVAEGNRALGQVGGNWAATQAIQAMRSHAVGIVALRGTGHVGRLGAYVEAVAESGAVGMAFCSGPPAGHRVAPFGGIDGRLATNPIAYAYPTADGPVVADLATSASTEGWMRNAARTGQTAPAGSLQNAAGDFTTDPAALYSSPAGTLLALGGEHFGHKGYALGLLVEVLATLMPGDRVPDQARYGNNLTLLAVEVDDKFGDRSAEMGAYVRSARPVHPGRPVELPGDREGRAQQAALGVPVDSKTRDDLIRAARTAGIAHDALKDAGA